jgi:predicted signal transduction protein with EAL and GGDEF domain
MLTQRRTITISPTLYQLQEKCKRLEVSRWFGCLNRNGLDEAIAGMDFNGLALVYADVDDLKTANEKWGKAQSSARIAQAIKMRGSDIVFGQWFSGDEFAAFVPVDHAYAFALRLQQNFKKVGMGVSICIAPITENASIEALADQCDERLTAVKKFTKGLIIFL